MMMDFQVEQVNARESKSGQSSRASAMSSNVSSGRQRSNMINEQAGGTERDQRVD